MSFYCWITLLTPAAIDSLIAGIVRRGRSVEPLSAEGEVTLSQADDVGCFVAIEIKPITADDRDRPAGDILDEIDNDLGAVIEEREIKHFGYALVGTGLVSTWKPGNVKVPAHPVPSAPPTAWARLGKT